MLTRSLLCRGCAPLLRSMRDAAKSQCPPGPPGRPRLRCMCVCVWDGVMCLCRSMCFLLSGRLSLAMRLLLRSAVLAVVVHLFSVSVSGAHVVCCSPSRLHIRCAVCCFFSVPPPTTHSCAYASLGWYTLYSIPGMHLWVLDHVKSKSTNTPTNIPANTKGAALPRAGGRGAQVQI